MVGLAAIVKGGRQREEWREGGRGRVGGKDHLMLTICEPQLSLKRDVTKGLPHEDKQCVALRYTQPPHSLHQWVIHHPIRCCSKSLQHCSIAAVLRIASH